MASVSSDVAPVPRPVSPILCRTCTMEMATVGYWRDRGTGSDRGWNYRVIPGSRICTEAIVMTVVTDSKFDITAFLSSAGLGRRLVRFNAKQVFFSQGYPADCVFYLQTGRAKLTVVSASGKEATISLLAPGEFIGEESIASVPGLRLATATAVTACTALKIEIGRAHV